MRRATSRKPRQSSRSMRSLPLFRRAKKWRSPTAAPQRPAMERQRNPRATRRLLHIPCSPPRSRRSPKSMTTHSPPLLPRRLATARRMEQRTIPLPQRIPRLAVLLAAISQIEEQAQPGWGRSHWKPGDRVAGGDAHVAAHPSLTTGARGAFPNSSEAQPDGFQCIAGYAQRHRLYAGRRERRASNVPMTGLVNFATTDSGGTGNPSPALTPTSFSQSETPSQPVQTNNTSPPTAAPSADTAATHSAFDIFRALSRQNPNDGAYAAPAAAGAPVPPPAQVPQTKSPITAHDGGTLGTETSAPASPADAAEISPSPQQANSAPLSIA